MATEPGDADGDRIPDRDDQRPLDPEPASAEPTGPEVREQDEPDDQRVEWTSGSEPIPPGYRLFGRTLAGRAIFVQYGPNDVPDRDEVPVRGRLDPGFVDLDPAIRHAKESGRVLDETVTQVATAGANLRLITEELLAGTRVVEGTTVTETHHTAVVTDDGHTGSAVVVDDNAPPAEPPVVVNPPAEPVAEPPEWRAHLWQIVALILGILALIFLLLWLDAKYDFNVVTRAEAGSALGQRTTGIPPAGQPTGQVSTQPTAGATTTQPTAAATSTTGATTSTTQPSGGASTAQALPQPSNCVNPSLKDKRVGTTLRMAPDDPHAIAQIQALRASHATAAMYFSQYADAAKTNYWLDWTSCAGMYSSVEVDNAFAINGGRTAAMEDWLNAIKGHDHLQYWALSQHADGVSSQELGLRADWLREKTGKQVMCFMDFPGQDPSDNVRIIRSLPCDVHLLLGATDAAGYSQAAAAIKEVDGDKAVGAIMATGAVTNAQIGEAAKRFANAGINKVFLYGEGPRNNDADAIEGAATAAADNLP